MTATRRDFLTSAVTAAGAAMTSGHVHAHEHTHGHAHVHQVVPSDPALRVKALESLLVGGYRVVTRIEGELFLQTYLPRVTRLLHALLGRGNTSVADTTKGIAARARPR